jgi:hypothetical protein
MSILSIGIPGGVLQQEGHPNHQGTSHRRPLGSGIAATEAALADIETEIQYPSGNVVADIEEVLQRKIFHDRIAGKLAVDPR